MTETENNRTDELLGKLVKRFGVTSSNKDGGYLLPDGSLLNLQRSIKSNKQYHREVAALLPEEMQGACDEITIVNLMIATGAIRYEAKGRVHVASEPTQAQRRKLFDIMKYSEHDYLIIVSDRNAATIGEQRFKSPQAHELLQFFNQCFNGEQRQYRTDEFSIHKNGDEYILTFRPGQSLAAHYNATSDTFTVQPDFEGILHFFRQQLALFRQKEEQI